MGWAGRVPRPARGVAFAVYLHSRGAFAVCLQGRPGLGRFEEPSRRFCRVRPTHTSFTFFSRGVPLPSVGGPAIVYGEQHGASIAAVGKCRHGIVLFWLVLLTSCS